MPDKLLHSEWVENFFSDGDERNREQSSLPTSKSKQSCNVDRKESLNCVPRQTDTSRETGEIKSDNGNGVSKKNPPKG